MFGFIYETTNKKNGKTYVGLCTHENPIKEGVYVYLGSGTVIKNAVLRSQRVMLSAWLISRVRRCRRRQSQLPAL